MSDFVYPVTLKERKRAEQPRGEGKEMMIVISAFSFSTFSFRHNKNRASIVGTLQNSPRAALTTMSPTPPLPEECVKHPGYGYCFRQCICTCYDVVPSTDPEKDDDELTRNVRVRSSNARHRRQRLSDQWVRDLHYGIVCTLRRTRA